MSGNDTDEVIAGLVITVNRLRAENEWLHDAFECVLNSLEAACFMLNEHGDEAGLARVRATMEEWGLTELKARGPSQWVM